MTSTYAVVVISPAITHCPVVTSVSQATRALGSCARIASRTPSEIWSATLSGWPMVTDSLVNRWLLRRKLLLDDWPIWWDTVRWLLIVLKPSPELVKGRADAFVSLNSCGKRGETGL